MEKRLLTKMLGRKVKVCGVTRDVQRLGPSIGKPCVRVCFAAKGSDQKESSLADLALEIRDQSKRLKECLVVFAGSDPLEYADLLPFLMEAIDDICGSFVLETPGDLMPTNEGMLPSFTEIVVTPIQYEPTGHPRDIKAVLAHAFRENVHVRFVISAVRDYDWLKKNKEFVANKCRNPLILLSGGKFVLKSLLELFHNDPIQNTIIMPN